MPFASSVAGRGCRQRDLRVFHLHELVLAGAAAFEASTNAVHIQFCWQELPPARLQRMPLVGIVAGRSFRWQGVRACRRQPLLRAGAARGTASAHAVCTHCCWQEKPPLARHHRMTCAFIVASRCCRRRAPAHAACRHCRWQVLPLTRHRRMPVASSVAGRGPPAGPQRMPLAHRRIPFASIAAGRFCHRRGLIACCLHASFSPTSMSLTRLGAAPALTNGVGGRGLRHRQVLDVNKCYFIDVERSQLVCDEGLQALRALPGLAAHRR